MPHKKEPFCQTSGASCAPRWYEVKQLKIRNAKCTSDFGQRRGQNFRHVVAAVAGKYINTSPSGAGHLDRRQSERHFDVLIYRGPSLHFAILILVNVKMPLTTCPHLAFLQFSGKGRPNFALSPYFFGLAHFDRILELGEQTGPLQEFFKNFLKTVPIYPRFFSY